MSNNHSVIKQEIQDRLPHGFVMSHGDKPDVINIMFYSEYDYGGPIVTQGTLDLITGEVSAEEVDIDDDDLGMLTSESIEIYSGELNVNPVFIRALLDENEGVHFVAVPSVLSGEHDFSEYDLSEFEDSGPSL